MSLVLLCFIKGRWHCHSIHDISVGGQEITEQSNKYFPHREGFPWREVLVKV